MESTTLEEGKEEGKEDEKKKDEKKEEKKEGEEEEEDLKKKEYSRPTAWGGWGFCSQLCTQTNYQGFLWSNEPRLKEILRRTSSHEDCRKHLEINVKEGEEISRLCLFQEQELAEKAHFSMFRKYFQQTINNFIFRRKPHSDTVLVVFFSANMPC